MKFKSYQHQLKKGNDNCTKKRTNIRTKIVQKKRTFGQKNYTKNEHIRTRNRTKKTNKHSNRNRTKKGTNTKSQNSQQQQKTKNITSKKKNRILALRTQCMEWRIGSYKRIKIILPLARHHEASRFSLFSLR